MSETIVSNDNGINLPPSAERETTSERRTLGESYAMISSLDTFTKQAAHPPGGDRIIGACYSAVLDLAQTHPRMIPFLASCESVRQLTDTHRVNLFLRILQHRQLKQGTFDYPELYADPNKWKEMLISLISDPESTEQFLMEMKTRETATTKLERYSSVAAVLALRGGSVDLVDVGCGGDVFNPVIRKGLPFGTIQDETSGQVVSTALKIIHDKITPGRLVSLDLRDWRFGDDSDFRLSCQFYPGELGPGLVNLHRTRAWENSLRDADTDFRLYNLLQDPVPTDLHMNVDVAAGLTFFYQLQIEEQNLMLEQMRAMLRPNRVGSPPTVLVFNEFATLDPLNPKLFATVQDWGRDGSYRTFVTGNGDALDPFQGQMKELFIFSNGRCGTVREGADFHEVVTALSSR